MSNTKQQKWKQATSKQMLTWFLARQAITPRWRIFRHHNLKKNIKYWESRL